MTDTQTAEQAARAMTEDTDFDVRHSKGHQTLERISKKLATEHDRKHKDIAIVGCPCCEAEGWCVNPYD